ncbi:Hypothetical protein D9617_9g023820 [Elsinoe fawcettii]|nr:Hypothetical protein D9617_9g023820 [Elsinoe fawcettii]
MKSTFAIVALALASHAAAAGQCSLTPFDDKAIQALAGGGGTGTAAPATAPKKRSLFGRTHLLRRADPAQASGSSTAIQPPNQVPPSNRAPQTPQTPPQQDPQESDNIEMMPPQSSGQGLTPAPAAQSNQQAPASPQLGHNTGLPFTNQDVEQQQQAQSSGAQLQQGGTDVAQASGSSKGVVGTCWYGICTATNWVFNKVTGAGALKDPAAINKLRNDWSRTVTAGLIAGTIAAITIERQTQAQNRVAAGQQNLQQQNAQMIGLMQDILAAGRCQISTSGQALSDFCQGIANPQARPAKRALTLAARDPTASCPKVSDKQKSDILLKLAESEGLSKLQGGSLNRMGIAFDGGTDAWVIFDPKKYPSSMQQLQSKGLIPKNPGPQTGGTTTGGSTTSAPATGIPTSSTPANGAPANGAPAANAPANGQTTPQTSGPQAAPAGGQQNSLAKPTSPSTSPSTSPGSPQSPTTGTGAPQPAPQTGKPATIGQTTTSTTTKPVSNTKSTKP